MENRFSLEMIGIEKRFGATIALKGVEFSVYPGEVHALVGENGAGKSTLMKILSGVHHPDKGMLKLEGKEFRPNSPLEARSHGIGMIYQELTLAPHLSVMENIGLGREPHRLGRLKRNEMRQIAVSVLKQLGHPELDPNWIVGKLSINQRQLVEIARSLAAGCRILVFDEPTSSLSRPDIQSLFRIIKELRSQKLAVVYISHFLEEVKEVADRISILRDGGLVGTLAIEEFDMNKIVGMMVGREVKSLYPRSRRSPGEVMLEIENISGVQKPKSADLILRAGEVVGIAGLVGAGRTEFLRCIFGLDSVRSGRIRIGAYFGPASPSLRWKQKVGMVSENRKEEGLALKMSLSDNLTLTDLKSFSKWGFIRPEKQDTAVRKWIRELDIRCRSPLQKADEISGGNQQKIALARLLQHDVDVLLLDEPTRGIDVAAKSKIYQIIDSLTHNTGLSDKPKTVLFTSSYLPELVGICDRIAVMHRGVLGPAKPIAEWDEESLMEAATGWDSALIES